MYVSCILRLIYLQFLLSYVKDKTNQMQLNAIKLWPAPFFANGK